MVTDMSSWTDSRLSVMDQSKVILIVGAGGTGSALFQNITRFAPKEYEIILVDGDIVEEKNILRQMFVSSDVGKNKAEVLTTKANNTIISRNNFYPYYLQTDENKGADTLENITEKYDNIVMFGCVDNHPARLQLEKFFKATQKNIDYIDCANGEHNGDIVYCYKIEGNTEGAVRSSYDASVLFEKDNDPNTKSCNELLDEGNIQTRVANLKSSIVALEVFAKIIDGKRKHGLVVFDKCVTRKRNKRMTI